MTRTISFFHQWQVRRGRWLMGVLVLLPALFFPPYPLTYRLTLSDFFHNNSFPYVAGFAHFGGLGTQLVSFIRLSRIDSVGAGDFLLVFVPSCLAVATLTLCVVTFWGWYVDRAARPTLLRAFLAVLGAISTSLVLVWLLFGVEIALFAAKEGQGFTLLSVAGGIFAAQLLFAPFLLIGGAILVTFQGSTENRRKAVFSDSSRDSNESS